MGFSLHKAATSTTEETKAQALWFLNERCYIVKSNSTIYINIFQLKMALILMNLGKL